MELLIKDMMNTMKEITTFSNKKMRRKLKSFKLVPKIYLRDDLDIDQQFILKGNKNSFNFSFYPRIRIKPRWLYYFPFYRRYKTEVVEINVADLSNKDLKIFKYYLKYCLDKSNKLRKEKHSLFGL